MGLDLRNYLLELMTPLTIGDDLVKGLRFTSASAELGLRLTFVQNALHEVHIEVSRVDDVTRRPAATSKYLAFSYRHGGAEQINQAFGLRTCRLVAAHVRNTENAVLTRLDNATAMAKKETSAKIREVTKTSILELGGVPGKRFYTLSPYLGCLIGCRFCYAQSRLAPVRSLLQLPEVPWGSYVDVLINAPELLEKELKELPPHPIKFCPIVSDPYQAIEKRYELTRRCIEVIGASPSPPPAMVMTRSTLMLRDFEIIRKVPNIWVGASIPTLDDEVCTHFEPRASSVTARLDMLRQFKDAGVNRCVVVQPMLPGDPIALADALSKIVNSVNIGILRGKQGAEKDFEDPRFQYAGDEKWQRVTAIQLRNALIDRGVDVWFSELPPQLTG